MSARCLALALSAASLTATSCGGTSDKDAVESALKTYLNGLSQHDGQKVCSVVGSQYVEFFKRATDTGAATCPEAFEAATGDDDYSDFGKNVITSIEVDGDRATMETKEPDGGTGKYKALKLSGKWKLVPPS